MYFPADLGYIASINIESTYHAVRGADTQYETFPGICLTDTFQLGEGGALSRAFPQLAENSERAENQRKLPIQVIVGNPPYSVGQKSGNDYAQNQPYANLERCIEKTYVARSLATNQRNLYDSYVKAFRWASDRIDKNAGGVIAFVSNAGWIDGKAMDGFRKCLEEEFSAIWVFNLRGNQRTSGELSRREGGKIFGSGSRTPIAITVLLKNPAHLGKALIQYHDIGDYLSREDKLATIKNKCSIMNSEFGWQHITPDNHGDWLNKRNSLFENFISLGTKDIKINKQTYFQISSCGLVTARDAWCYNFSTHNLSDKIKHTIEYYNILIKQNAYEVGKASTISGKDISMTRAFRNDMLKKRAKHFNSSALYESTYRPFVKNICYFSNELNEYTFKLPILFPIKTIKNFVICVSGVGSSKSFSCIITDSLPDFQLQFNAQCYPLYFYELSRSSLPSLLSIDKNGSLHLPYGIGQFNQAIKYIDKTNWSAASYS